MPSPVSDTSEQYVLGSQKVIIQRSYIHRVTRGTYEIRTHLLQLPVLGEILGVIIPQEQHVVHRHPGMVDFWQQPHEAHALDTVPLASEGRREHGERSRANLTDQNKKKSNIVFIPLAGLYRGMYSLCLKSLGSYGR